MVPEGARIQLVDGLAAPEVPDLNAPDRPKAAYHVSAAFSSPVVRGSRKNNSWEIPAVARKFLRWGRMVGKERRQGLTIAAFARHQLERVQLGGDLEAVEVSGKMFNGLHPMHRTNESSQLSNTLYQSGLKLSWG